MKNLAHQLRQLMDEARSCPAADRERRQKFTEIFRLVSRSRKLWRENTPYYEDALQEMWEYCYQNLEEYDPTIKGVITWLDDELKKRLRKYRSRWIRQQQRQATDRQTDEGQTRAIEDNIPSPPDLQPVLEIQKTTLSWVLCDPDRTLRDKWFRERREINARALIRRRFPVDMPWRVIATEFSLTEAEAKDLPKFYSRKCLPLLREFGAAQGYIELASEQKSSRTHQLHEEELAGLALNSQEVLHSILTDEQGVLRRITFKNRSEISAWLLILWQLSPNILWSSICATFSLTPSQTEELPNFYRLECLPLLQRFNAS